MTNQAVQQTAIVVLGLGLFATTLVVVGTVKLATVLADRKLNGKR